MAEQIVTAQLVDSTDASKPAYSRSLQESSQATAQNMPSSQRTFARSSLSGYFLCPLALPSLTNCVFDNLVSFQLFNLYGLSLLTMSVLLELYRVIVVLCVIRASLTISLPRAFRSSSPSLGSMSPTSFHSAMIKTNPSTSASISISSTTPLCISALCTHSWGTNLRSVLLSLACHCQSFGPTVRRAHLLSEAAYLLAFPASVSALLARLQYSA